MILSTMKWDITLRSYSFFLSYLFPFTIPGCFIRDRIVTDLLTGEDEASSYLNVIIFFILRYPLPSYMSFRASEKYIADVLKITNAKSKLIEIDLSSLASNIP